MSLTEFVRYHALRIKPDIHLLEWILAFPLSHFSAKSHVWYLRPKIVFSFTKKTKALWIPAKRKTTRSATGPDIGLNKAWVWSRCKMIFKKKTKRKVNFSPEKLVENRYFEGIHNLCSSYFPKIISTVLLLKLLVLFYRIYEYRNNCCKSLAIWK